MTTQDVRNKVMAFSSPCITFYSYSDGTYAVKHPYDVPLFQEYRIPSVFTSDKYDEILEKVSQAGYWLESVEVKDNDN